MAHRVGIPELVAIFVDATKKQDDAICVLANSREANKQANRKMAAWNKLRCNGDEGRELLYLCLRILISVYARQLPHSNCGTRRRKQSVYYMTWLPRVDAMVSLPSLSLIHI